MATWKLSADSGRPIAWLCSPDGKTAVVQELSGNMPWRASWKSLAGLKIKSELSNTHNESFNHAIVSEYQTNANDLQLNKGVEGWVAKHTSSVEEIIANDLRSWMAQAKKCSEECPLLAQLKNDLKAFELLIKYQQNNDTQ
jgi:hypothetical protein